MSRPVIGMVLPSPFFESRIRSVPSTRVQVRQGQVERLGDPEAGVVQHPEQDRVDQRLVRVGGHGLRVDRGEQAAHLIVGEHIRRLVTDTDASCRGRGVGIPADGLGVLGQLAQRQLVAPDCGGPQVTAVAGTRRPLLW